MTYGDAKPIIDANCVTCHHADGSAPLALETYEQVPSHLQGKVVAAAQLEDDDD